jgi:hypothetical protein
MFRSTRRLLITVAVIAAIAVLLLPALVAYRYTAPSQRNDFVTRPWRGWSFVVTAVAVPGGSELKTSGDALRKAEWVYRGTVVDPTVVQLLFVEEERPYTLRHAIDGRSVSTTVTPSYRFIWQVQGIVSTVSDRSDTIVALFDYETGRLLYDVRDDLTPQEASPPLGESATDEGGAGDATPSGLP